MGKTKDSLLDTRPKLIIGSIVLLLISYTLGSWAIDSGSWWGYGGCVIFLAVAVKFLVMSVRIKKEKD